MGAQLATFIQGIGTGLKGRTCDGPLPDDSTFKIAFNYDDADIRYEVALAKFGLSLMSGQSARLL